MSNQINLRGSDRQYKERCERGSSHECFAWVHPETVKRLIREEKILATKFGNKCIIERDRLLLVLVTGIQVGIAGYSKLNSVN